MYVLQTKIQMFFLKLMQVVSRDDDDEEEMEVEVRTESSDGLCTERQYKCFWLARYHVTMDFRNVPEWANGSDYPFFLEVIIFHCY